MGELIYFGGREFDRIRARNKSIEYNQTTAQYNPDVHRGWAHAARKDRSRGFNPLM